MTDHVDVLIVGAGLSGVGAAHHLRERCPDKTFAVLEAREAVGGTWDLFRYPGIRSDSDMYTLGYSFRPWEEPKSIADGPSILEYIRATAREDGLDRHLRLGHRVVRAAWSSADARWTVEVERTATGDRVSMTCSFLFACSGYYRYDKGHTPELPGAERFGGTLVHPQLWPEDLDYAGRRVVVIGSGATAVTLVPAMAGTAAHVTMLQRSPSYVVTLPSRDPFAGLMRRLFPAKVAYGIVRAKNVALSTGFFHFCRRAPRWGRAVIRRQVARQLPADFDVDRHFTPRYEPWDQRLCLVPDGDLFAALSSGGASIVTDEIETFTETGIRLASGGELEADVVVTATGLEAVAFGGIQLAVDGRDVALEQTVGYRGMMLAGVPNFAAAIGYTNASWTLKCDLTCAYVCRLLNHMAAAGATSVTPRAEAAPQETEPFIDLKAGYVLRAIDRFPRQGTRPPWRLHQNYARDTAELRFGTLDDGVLEFAA